MAKTLRFLRRDEVCERTGLNKDTINYLERRGEFPQRRRLTARLVGWVEAEIIQWIKDRPLGADTATAAAVRNLRQYHNGDKEEAQ